MSAQHKQTPRWNGASADTNTDSVAIIGGHLVDRKTFETLRAQFALASYELYLIRKRDGVAYFEVCRWHQARCCSTLHELRAMLTQVGGAA